jgi:cytochrome c oxidase subunit IV
MKAAHQHTPRQGPTLKGYIFIWAALLLLLLATWGAAQLNLGEWNTVVALTIAVMKMLLVVLFFMHVRYGSRQIWLFTAAGFIWLIIMIDLTLSDFLTRGMVKGWRPNIEQTTPSHPRPVREPSR